MHGSAGRALTLSLGNLGMLAGGIHTFKNTEAMHTLIGKCNGASVTPHAVIFVFGMRNVEHK